MMQIILMERIDCISEDNNFIVVILYAIDWAYGSLFVITFLFNMKLQYQIHYIFYLVFIQITWFQRVKRTGVNVLLYSLLFRRKSYMMQKTKIERVDCTSEDNNFIIVVISSTLDWEYDNLSVTLLLHVWYETAVTISQ